MSAAPSPSFPLEYRCGFVATRLAKKFPLLNKANLTKPYPVDKYKEAFHYLLLDTDDKKVLKLVNYLCKQLKNNTTVTPGIFIWFYQNAVVSLNLCTYRSLVAVCESYILDVIGTVMGINQEDKKRGYEQVPSVFATAVDHKCANFVDLVEDCTYNGAFTYAATERVLNINFCPDQEGPLKYCDKVYPDERVQYMTNPCRDKVTGQVRDLRVFKYKLGMLYDTNDEAWRRKINHDHKKLTEILDFKEKFQVKPLKTMDIKCTSRLSMLGFTSPWFRHVESVHLKADDYVFLQTRFDRQTVTIEANFAFVESLSLTGLPLSSFNFKARLKIDRFKQYEFSKSPWRTNELFPRLTAGKFCNSGVIVLLDEADFKKLKHDSTEQFQDNTELVAIAWPSKHYELPKAAHKGAVGLHYLNLPPYIRRIPRNAFGLCYNLKHLCLPGNVGVLDLYAFPYSDPWHSSVFESAEFKTCGICHITALGIYDKREANMRLVLKGKNQMWRKLFAEHDEMTITCPKSVFASIKQYLNHKRVYEMEINRMVPVETFKLKWDTDSYPKLLEKYFWHRTKHKAQQHPKYKWLGLIDTLQPNQKKAAYTFFMCMSRPILVTEERASKRQKKSLGYLFQLRFVFHQSCTIEF